MANRTTIGDRPAIGVWSATGVNIYFGETARTAGQRAKEQKMHTRNGHIELSAVANHAHAAAHNIHWVKRVLTKEKNATKRKVKEELAVKAATKQK